MKIEFNKNDLARIQGKLARLQDNCKGIKGTPVFDITLSYVTAYQTTIVKAMGSVEGAQGGTPDLTYLGKSENVYWHALSSYTLEFQQKEGLSTAIWVATGETRKAVEHGVELEVSGPVKSFFAGLDKAKNPEEYQRAIETEFGGAASNFVNREQWPSRPLFTIANHIFASNKGVILAAIKQAALAGVNWGG